MAKLYIVRGPSGSGKSTYAAKVAKELNDLGQVVDHYEADMYFIKDGTYQWDATLLGNAHSWCKFKVSESLKNGRNVIVSNTSILHKDVKGYIALADEYEVDYEVIRVIGNFKNIHNVPEDRVKEMRDKFQPWDGETVIDNTVS